MFEIKDKSAKLVTVNPRTELHGQDHVPACDIVFSFDAANEALDMFHQNLRASLYQKDDVPSDMFPREGALTVYRFVQIEKLKWGVSYEEAALTVHHGVSGQKDVVLADVGIDNFVIYPKQGGTCTIQFRVKARPTEDQLGRLCTWIQGDVTVTVTQKPAEPDLTEEAQKPKKVKQSAKERAESMFVE